MTSSKDYLWTEKIKVYIYTRVSTYMQIDRYSLDTQKASMKTPVTEISEQAFYACEQIERGSIKC